MKNYVGSEPITKMCRIFNSVCVMFDFEISSPILKKNVFSVDISMFK